MSAGFLPRPAGSIAQGADPFRETGAGPGLFASLRQIARHRAGRRVGSPRAAAQNSPVMAPSGPTSLPSALGLRGKPGIVVMSPVSATTNPAPAEM